MFVCPFCLKIRRVGRSIFFFFFFFFYFKSGHIKEMQYHPCVCICSVELVQLSNLSSYTFNSRPRAYPGFFFYNGILL